MRPVFCLVAALLLAGCASTAERTTTARNSSVPQERDKKFDWTRTTWDWELGADAFRDTSISPETYVDRDHLPISMDLGCRAIWDYLTVTETDTTITITVHGWDNHSSERCLTRGVATVELERPLGDRELVDPADQDQ